ncbi:MAG: FecR domain-containing protein [Balneolaceae bacterium]
MDIHFHIQKTGVKKVNRRDLLQYLSNEKWLNTLPENERLMEEVDLVLAIYGNSSDEKFDVQKDWEALRYRILEDEEEQRVRKKQKRGYEQKFSNARGKRKTLSEDSTYNRRSGFLKAFSIAAVFLIAALAGVLTLNNYQTVNQGEGEKIFRQVNLDKGQRANMVLSDGTNISFNADTRVELPETFDRDKREVFLHEGEAYFEVAADPDRPFLIHSRGAVIRVLGTSFSVRSYPEDKTLQVAVKEGTVTLAPVHDESNKLTLTTRQLGLYSLADQRLSTEEIEDMDLFLSWTEGVLKFKDTPLTEVARQLERRYNVEIEFGSPELKKLRLTAEFKSRSMNNVLNVLSASLGISYFEEDWQRITFIKGNSALDTKVMLYN